MKLTSHFDLVANASRDELLLHKMVRVQSFIVGFFMHGTVFYDAWGFVEFVADNVLLLNGCSAKKTENVLSEVRTTC